MTVVACVKCGQRTTDVLAADRRWRRGRCAECGGRLAPPKPAPCRVCGENMTPDGRTCDRCQTNLDEERNQ